jgi:hypothetical protein
MTVTATRLVLVLDGPVLEASTMRLRDRVLARFRALALDRRLATGEPPEASRLLAVRAARITTVASRRRLAACWDRLLRLAGQDPVAFTTRMPLQRSQILAASQQIHQLVELLTDERPVAARGVAMASRLLTEPSPAFRIGHFDTPLPRAVEEAVAALADD